MLFVNRNLSATKQRLHPLVTSKRRHLFLTGDNDEVFVTKPVSVTLKTTEQHLGLTVYSGKSEAEVITVKKLCSSYYTIEANY